MSLAERILSGLKTVVLIDERVTTLSQTIKGLKTGSEAGLTEHERCLTRLETIIEIARPTAQLCASRRPDKFIISPKDLTNP